jgi:hypothetical protein
VNINASTISGNTTRNGLGTLFVGGNVTLSNNVITGNTTGQSGTIITSGTVTISNCTISGNTTTFPDSAGGISAAGTVLVEDSTISGNTGSVGGIRNAGDLTVINSTISGNTGNASEPIPTAGGIANFALFKKDVTITLLNATVANNTVHSNNHAGSQLYSGQLGPETGKATIQLRNTLIVGDGSAPNFFAGTGGTFTSQGHNLSSDNGGGFLTGPGDLINANPLLGPLQDNGGPTPTMALLPGSLAVDAGDNTGAPDFDQRGPGFPRIVAGIIDIGAFEVQPGPASHFQVSAPAQVTSNAPFDVTVIGLDAYGHTAVGYLGTVTFSSSDTDPGIILPANYAFMASDGGVHVFANGAKLRTPGSQTIRATDTLVPSISGSASVVVSPPLFLVTTTADSGPGSLRQAILDADGTPGLDIIDFAIGTGIQTLNLVSPLPAITQPVLLDGTSQPGFTGAPIIELDGAASGPGADGLLITAGNSTVRGLVINRFTSNGIELQNNGGNVIQGNYIGTDVTGTMALGNGMGLRISTSNNTVGGTTVGARNVISGNLGDGVFISDSGTGNVVQGNFIGTDASSTVNLGNANNGVHLLNASGNTIGGTGDGAANVISFNGNDGVLVDTGSGNGIRRNAIYGHASGLGIELLNGGNNRLPFPVLTSAISDGSSTTVVGLLESTPNTGLTLEFFANRAANPSGFGEGERFLGASMVTTNSHGTVSFLVTFTSAVPTGQFIAATASDPNNDTSAFSNSVGVGGPAGPSALVPGLHNPGIDKSVTFTPILPALTLPPDNSVVASGWTGSALGAGYHALLRRGATDYFFGQWHRMKRGPADNLFANPQGELLASIRADGMIHG